jgi:hypothetical protein
LMFEGNGVGLECAVGGFSAADSVEKVHGAKVCGFDCSFVEKLHKTRQFCNSILANSP